MHIFDMHKCVQTTLRRGGVLMCILWMYRSYVSVAYSEVLLPGIWLTPCCNPANTSVDAGNDIVVFILLNAAVCKCNWFDWKM